MQIDVYGLFRYVSSFSFIVFDSGWGPVTDCCWYGNEPSFSVEAGKYLTRWGPVDFPKYQLVWLLSHLARCNYYWSF